MHVPLKTMLTNRKLWKIPILFMASYSVEVLTTFFPYVHNYLNRNLTHLKSYLTILYSPLKITSAGVKSLPRRSEVKHTKFPIQLTYLGTVTVRTGPYGYALH